MSYDLQVFSRQSLSPDDLRQLVAVAGLAVEGSEATAAAFTVLRGAKRQYCFTLGMPAAVETEDVPEEVTAVLLAPTCMYELLVEGSSATETPHAVRFARRLAEASGGVVLDQQTGLTWHRGQLRTSSPVPRGAIDVVQLHWYTRLADTDGASRGREPLDRDQLVAALAIRSGQSGARRSLFARLTRRDVPRTDDIGTTLLPSDLQPIVDRSDPNLYVPPLEPARRVPPELAPPS